MRWRWASTYDSVGNLTSDGTKTYTWDCMNRLVSIAQSGQSTVYYTYRPDGLRATTKQIGAGAVTRYVYEGQNLIAEKDGSNDLQTSYTVGKGEVISRTDWSGETPATVFFLYDGNCNLDAVVDEGGNLVKQFTYDVFGAVRETLVGSGAETVGFAGGVGHITDLENSLVYMRARYYDPSIGRFISEDPGCNGTNWYIYCGNNPVNGVDPSGCYGVNLETSCAMYYLGVGVVLIGCAIMTWGIAPTWKKIAYGAADIAFGMSLMVAAFAGVNHSIGYDILEKFGGWAVGAIASTACVMNKLDVLPGIGAVTAAVVSYEAALTAAYLAGYIE